MEIVPQPWEQQISEPLPKFRMFASYRDMMPKRSFSKVAKLHGLKISTINGYAQTWKWRSRAEAWDKHLDQLIRETQTEAIVQMRERHIQMSLDMQKMANKETQAWLNRVSEAIIEAQTEGREFHTPILPMNELLRLIEYSTKLERLNRGESTDKTEVENTKDKAEQVQRQLDNLSPAEKRKMLALKRKAVTGVLVEEPEEEEEENCA